MQKVTLYQRLPLGVTDDKNLSQRYLVLRHKIKFNIYQHPSAFLVFSQS